MEWTQLETDALNEFFNLGLGRAAGSIGELTGREVDIHAPTIEFLPTENVLDFVPEENADNIVSIRLGFDGVIYGDSYLIMTDQSSNNLVRIILSQHMDQDANMGEYVADTLGEVGNIILNACLAAFCDTLNIELENGLPDVRMNTKESFLANLNTEADATGIVAHLKFSLQGAELEGFILVYMEKGTLATLRAKVSSFLRGVMDE